MKKLYSLLLVGSLVFGVSTIAKAQPPNPPEPQIQINQKHLPRTPESTIQGFTGEIGGLETYYGDIVEGYDPRNPINSEISRIIKHDLGNFVLTATDITIVPNPQNKDLATANFSLELYDAALGLGFAQRDSVQLKRHPITDNRIGGKDEYWTILPGDPQSYFKSFNDTFFQINRPIWVTTPEHSDNSLPIESGFTERLATLLAYPKQMLSKIHLQQSGLQLRQLGLALFMYGQDYNEQLAFTHQNYVEKLTPYLKNKAVFTAPDENSNAISYDVNPNIAGLKLTQDLDYEDTVAFYLGKDQKLDFRYDGLSPVCFLDGHVEAITPEEAKHLQWKP